MTEITTYIEVELAWLANHSWPNAPDHREYLKPLHQHMWEIKVRVSVGHLDRDVEFHDLRDEVWKIIRETNFNNSCEGIAKDIYEQLKGDVYYPVHKVAVWVGEEGNVRGKYGEVVV